MLPGFLGVAYPAWWTGRRCKHDVTSGPAATVSRDPRLLTVAEWGAQRNRRTLVLCWMRRQRRSAVRGLHLVGADPAATDIRLISARKATQAESRQYQRAHEQSIERSVWEYFSGKVEQRWVDSSDLLTEVLRREIEINEALK